jgi:hypothetical protein
MINCHQLSFSISYSEKRTAIANKVIGTRTVKRIIAFALYLLGASRNAIAEILNLPYDTFRSFSQRMEQDGISALIDRRLKQKAIPEINHPKPPKGQVDFTPDFLIIYFGIENQSLKIPVNNTIQIRTVVLTMLKNNVINIHTASQALNCHPVHVQRLNRQLQNDDAAIFINKRLGQKKDYVFDLETKAEMVQQYIANLVNKKNTSSQALSEDLKERCDLDLASRTIRLHIAKMGLSKIKKSLPELIDSFKKN